LKLGEIYYKGLLHTTAKAGATGSGNSVPPSFPDRRDVGLRHTETGATEIWKLVPPDFDKQQINKLSIDMFSPPLSSITQKGPGGSWTSAHGSSSSSS
jgi:hypothetical protein